MYVQSSYHRSWVGDRDVGEEAITMLSCLAEWVLSWQRLVNQIRLNCFMELALPSTWWTQDAEMGVPKGWSRKLSVPHKLKRYWPTSKATFTVNLVFKYKYKTKNLLFFPTCILNHLLYEETVSFIRSNTFCI